MKSIEQQGKNVDDAIEKALRELEVKRDQVSVEILDEGSRGLFGLMGSKPAKVKVTVHETTTYSAIKEELATAHVPQEKPTQETLKKPEAKKQETPAPKSSTPREAPDAQEAAAKPSEEDVQKIVDSAKHALQVILTQLGVEYTIEMKQRDDQILLNIHCENENFLIGRRGTTLDAIQYLVNRIANKQAQEKVQVVLDTSNYRVNRKDRLEKLAMKLSHKVKRSGRPVTVAPMNPHDRRIIHLTLQDDPAVKTLSRGTGFMRRIIISSSRDSNRNRKK